MTVYVIGGLAVVLFVLLFLRRLQLQPDGVSGGTTATWDQPSPAARVQPPPVSVQAYTERDIGPSIGQIATGVFLGLWMFVLSAVGIGIIVTVIVFGSLAGIAD